MSAQAYRQQQEKMRQNNARSITKTEGNRREEEERSLRNIEKLYDET